MRVVLVLAVLMASCAGGGSGAVETERVSIFDVLGRPETEWGYDPAEIRVASGTTVTFTNDGAVFHTVTSDDPGRSFDVGANPGETVTIVFDEPGTWPYHCGVHPDMKAVVHVCDGECR